MNDTNGRDAALGAVLGALVGDAAGAVLEFFGQAITAADVEHALAMPGGGTWAVAPGQVTDDGELTMSLLNALVASPNATTEAAIIDISIQLTPDTLIILRSDQLTKASLIIEISVQFTLLTLMV